MARHILLVQTNAIAGMEREFNDWYSNTHLRDIIAIPGFVAAQRFERSEVRRFPDTPVYPYRYLATYEIEGDVREAFDNLNAAASGPNPIPITPALEQQRTAYAFTPITERITR